MLSSPYDEVRPVSYPAPCPACGQEAEWVGTPYNARRVKPVDSSADELVVICACTRRLPQPVMH